MIPLEVCEIIQLPPHSALCEVCATYHRPHTEYAIWRVRYCDDEVYQVCQRHLRWVLTDAVQNLRERSVS